VKLFKIKAHSGDAYNEKVDQMAKNSLTSSALNFIINDQLNTTLYFNCLAIASPIRQFIKHITRAEAFTSFLNLDINHKYTSLDIDWITTSKYISDNSASNVTTYKASALMKTKIQRILEMLPTMETLKKRHPLLFDNIQPCIRCDSVPEDFVHLWTCPMIIHKLQALVNNSKKLLVDILQSDHLNQQVEQLNIWSISPSAQISFIDLIKGIIPFNLMHLIKSAFTSQNDSFAAVSTFMHFIFEQSQEIWKDRCSILKDFESAHNITDARKRSLTESTRYSFPTYQAFYDYNYLVDTMVRYGSHWSNFWCSRGQALFLV